MAQLFPPTIDYEPPRGYVSRSRYRFVLFLTLLNFLLLLGFAVGPPAWRWARAKAAARRAAAWPPAPVVSPPPAPAAAPATRSAAQQAALDEVNAWMNYAPPADRVVYEEHLEPAKALLKPHAPYKVSPVEKYRDRAWAEQLRQPKDCGWLPPVFYDAKVPTDFNGSWPENLHTVFIHSLTSPAGNVRLVHLRIEPDAEYEYYSSDGARVYQYVIACRRQLQCDVMAIGTRLGVSGGLWPDATVVKTQYFRDSTGFGIGEFDEAEALSTHLIATIHHLNDPRHPYTYRLEYHDENCLRLFAGQADPADAGHFTVRYVMGNAPGLLEGRLRDDDTISFRPPASGPWRLHEHAGGAYDRDGATK